MDTMMAKFYIQIGLLFTLSLTLSCRSLSAESTDNDDHSEPHKEPSTSLPELGARQQAALSGCTQLIIVVTESWESAHGKMALFERGEQTWLLSEGPFPVNIGHSGMKWGRGVTSPPQNAKELEKREGDGASPAGIFQIGEVLGWDEEPPTGLSLRYVQSTEQTHCVDDPQSPYYNRIMHVEKDEVTWDSSEILCCDTPYNRLLLLIGHNGLAGDDTPLSGAGSCIFLHVWTQPEGATIGCTETDHDYLRQLLLSIKSPDSVLLVQLPRAEYEAAVEQWLLPSLPEQWLHDISPER